MIIDRIENGIAVIEDDGHFIEADASKLPCGAKEGSVLIRCGEVYVLDPYCEKQRRKAAIELKKRLFRKKKST